MFYYYDAGGKPRREIPLGGDLVKAMRKWCDFEADGKQYHERLTTFRYVAERYCREVLITKAPRTQRDNLIEIDFLYKFFDDPPALMSEIRPLHIRQYLSWRADVTRQWYIEKGRKVPERAGHTRANRDIALFSHIFNFARASGFTDAANPCQGVKKHKEYGREVYVEDDVFEQVYTLADQPLRDAMDLAYLTGQRPSDTLRFSEEHLKKGELWIAQGKTGKKLRISVVGELADVLERIRVRKLACRSRVTAFVVNEKGERLTSEALRSRFDRARERAKVEKGSFQFRDIRAKAGTDKTDASGDIRAAQLQLGHNSITMTERYVRQRKGDRVTPTR